MVIRPNASQVKDTGMVAGFLMILAGFFFKTPLVIKAAAITLLIDMVWPGFFYPLAILWFGASALMAAMMSKIVLLILYGCLVSPIAFLGRLWGRDTLLLKAWGKGTGSVFQVRDHTYVSEDLETPY